MGIQDYPGINPAEVKTRSPTPFRFYSSSILVKLTGERAANIIELRKALERVSGSSIFHHTHHAFQERSYVVSTQKNDFARWVGESLGENLLAEKLAYIDIYEFVEIRALRNRIIQTIDEYLATWPIIRNCPPGEEFHFCEAISVVTPTDYLAYNLTEFKECLTKVGVRSLYYHFYQARLRLKRKTNDFSVWIEQDLNNPKLAQEIEGLDYYMYAIENLREKLITLIGEYI